MISSDIICQIKMMRYLGLHLEWNNYHKFDTNGHLSTGLYDKKDDCNCAILNFPLRDSNIPSATPQLIRYTRASSLY
jgi:hypothetical protein